jgi:hypothetical protein
LKLRIYVVIRVKFRPSVLTLVPAVEGTIGTCTCSVITLEENLSNTREEKISNS